MKKENQTQGIQTRSPVCCHPRALSAPPKNSTSPQGQTGHHELAAKSADKPVSVQARSFVSIGDHHCRQRRVKAD